MVVDNFVVACVSLVVTVEVAVDRTGDVVVVAVILAV